MKPFCQVALGATMTSLCAHAVIAAPLFVDADAPKGGDGLTWDTAFQTIEAAVATATIDAGFDEIRIADGLYEPDEASLPLVLPEGITLTGGFFEPDEDGYSFFVFPLVPTAISMPHGATLRNIIFEFEDDLAGADGQTFISAESGEVNIERCVFRNFSLGDAAAGIGTSGLVGIQLLGDEPTELQVRDSSFFSLAAPFFPAIEVRTDAIIELQVQDSEFIGFPIAGRSAWPAFDVSAGGEELGDFIVRDCEFRGVAPFGFIDWDGRGAVDAGNQPPQVLFEGCSFSGNQGVRSFWGTNRLRLPQSTLKIRGAEFAWIESTGGPTALIEVLGGPVQIEDTSFRDVSLAPGHDLLYIRPFFVPFEVPVVLLEGVEFSRISAFGSIFGGGRLCAGFGSLSIAASNVAVSELDTNAQLFEADWMSFRNTTVRDSALGAVLGIDGSFFDPISRFDGLTIERVRSHPDGLFFGTPLVTGRSSGPSVQVAGLTVRDYAHNPDGRSVGAFATDGPLTIEDALFHDTSGPLFSPNFSDGAAFRLDRVTIVDHGGPLALGEDLELDVRNSVLDGASLSVAGPVTYRNSLLANEPGANATLINSVTGLITFADRFGPDKIPATGDEDLSLADGSAGLDLANYGPLSGVSTDIDGNPRFLDGSGDGRRAPDAGAFEAQRGEIADCDADVSSYAALGIPDGQVSAADLGFFVESWLAGLPGTDLTTEGTNPGESSFGEPDGRLTISDLTFFVELWLDGCP